MIIKVEQTKSNFQNRFEVKVNNELKYLAGTPWMDFGLPVALDRKRSCILTGVDGNIKYITSYNILENFKNTVVPMKWLITGEQKSSIFYFLDENENVCGRFYEMTNGFMDCKWVIEYGDYQFLGYDISKGKTRNIVIHNNGVQIAQIVKPLTVIDNLDQYYIFLLDDYSWLEEVLSFYTVLFDSIAYPNKGNVVYQKKEVNLSYSYSKNDHFLDNNWIIDHFCGEEVEHLYNKFIKKRREEGDNKDNKLMTIALLIILGFVVVSIFVLVMVYRKYYG